MLPGCRIELFHVNLVMDICTIHGTDTIFLVYIIKPMLRHGSYTAISLGQCYDMVLILLYH